MAISHESLNAILDELPEPQRKNAMHRILQADAHGWIGISVWTWFLARRHEADLVGLSPKGEFRFVPYEGTLSER